MFSHEWADELKGQNYKILHRSDLEVQYLKRMRQAYDKKAKDRRIKEEFQGLDRWLKGTFTQYCGCIAIGSS